MPRRKQPVGRGHGAGDDEYTLIVYLPQVGTPTAERLAMLASWVA
jgi:hypothetical protein